MNIENQEFYHIRNETFYNRCYRQYCGIQWDVGAEFEVNKSKLNPFSAYYDLYDLTTDITNSNGQKLWLDAIEFFLTQPEQYQNNNYKNLLIGAGVALRDLCVFIRETTFEEVRLRHFPMLPSRKNCLFVCSKETVGFWWDKLNMQNHQIVIYKLNLTGIVHKGNNTYLNNNTHNHNIYRQNAFNYWKGIGALNPKEEEILFEGLVQVIDQYNSIEDFNNKVINIPVV